MGRSTPIDQRENLGTVIGAIGILVAIIAIFPTWYYVDADIDTGLYSTNGEKRIVTLDGWYGVRVNELQQITNGTDTGTSTPAEEWTFFFPIGVFSIIHLVYRLIRVLFTKRCITRGKMLTRAAIGSFIPIILVFLIVLFLPELVGKTLSLFFVDIMQEQSAPTQALIDVLDAISNKPWGGTYTDDFGDWGTARLNWGIGLGILLKLGSIVLLFIGGFIEKSRE